MNVKVNFSDYTIEKIIKHLIIIIDTREQENSHITEFLDKKKIPYIVKKLNFGDYSCMIKANEELGLLQDVSLENSFAVERKNSLEEISNNITNKRTEFENEFLRAKEKGCKINLVIENGSWLKIAQGKYNTKTNTNSFYNSLLSFSDKYNLNIDYVPKELTALHILKIFQIRLKSRLKE